MKPSLPGQNSDAYLWWSRGAEDNQAENDLGLSTGAIELREVLEGIARNEGIGASRKSIILAMARIYCPHILRRRYRNEKRD
jgi:hypothetical protein